MYITALKRLGIFSNLFDSNSVGIPIINEWTGGALLCCHGKKSSSYTPTSKVIRSPIYGQISLKTSNAF